MWEAGETPAHSTHLGLVCLLDCAGHLGCVACGGAALPQTLGLPLGLTTLGLQLAQLTGRVDQPLKLQVDGAAVGSQGHSTALWYGSPQSQDSHHTCAGQSLHVARHCRSQGACGLVRHFQETCRGERKVRPGPKETGDEAAVLGSAPRDSGTGSTWGPEAHSRAGSG